MLRTAAWTTPVVLVAAPAPALAASVCSTGGASCPDIAFGSTVSTPGGTPAGTTNGSGNTVAGSWTYTTTATGWTNSNNVGFVAPSTTGTYANKGTVFYAAAEPTSARTLTLTLAGVSLLAACRYTISLGVGYYASSAPDPVVTAFVGTTQSTASYTVTQVAGTSTGQQLGTTQSFPIPAGASGQVSITITFGGSGNYDDFELYQPALTCA